MSNIEKLKELHNKFALIKPIMICGILKVCVDSGKCTIGDITIDISSVKSVDNDTIMIGESK